MGIYRATFTTSTGIKVIVEDEHPTMQDFVDYLSDNAADSNVAGEVPNLNTVVVEEVIRQ